MHWMNSSAPKGTSWADAAKKSSLYPLAIAKLCLSEGISQGFSQLVENSIINNFKKKIYSNFLDRSESFLGLNQCYHIII